MVLSKVSENPVKALRLKRNNFCREDKRVVLLFFITFTRMKFIYDPHINLLIFQEDKQKVCQKSSSIVLNIH